ncbi:hypothetical protein PU634_10400 [Oceanimonas pelagia]|uniref:Uncharacterized protein n=1 Tax=Oceanimonas pelagia TaxID=3028314 RepID=A0AA50KJY4_9GAMM|nr:hypothetical protein [Oceanimonas pelagia]WMC09526.1 hypothetical protein PU634_10400 [Oceanimonas pelagia]
MAILRTNRLFHPINARKPVIVVLAQKHLRAKAAGASRFALNDYRFRGMNQGVLMNEDIARRAVEDWYELERLAMTSPVTACEMAEGILLAAQRRRADRYIPATAAKGFNTEPQQPQQQQPQQQRAH